MATVTCFPAAPEAVTDSCRVTVTGADQNTGTGYNASNYPASPEMRYYLAFTLGGEEFGRSYVFGVSDDGTHVFNNYVFPDDGAWTITLTNVTGDASVATASVTVAATS